MDRVEFTKVLGKYGLSDKQIDALEAEISQIFESECQQRIERTVKDDADRCAGYD